jgi:hypothetical protein
LCLETQFKLILNPRANSWFLRKKNLKNGTLFWAKVELFLVLPKFDWKKIFQKFHKKMVETIMKCSWILIFDHLLALIPVDYRRKVGFPKAHCEVQKQPNLDFSCWGPNPSPFLKFNLHMKSLRLDPWPPGSSKSPIFPIFEVN